MTLASPVYPASAGAARVSPGRSLSGRRSLLVVGDEQIATLCTSGPLDSLYAVEKTPTLETALARLSRLQPGILLTELGLRDGDGVELCRAVRAGSGPRVVLITTSDVARVPRALVAGCDSVLLKPFAPNLLFARLGRLTRDLQSRLALPTIPVGTNQRWPTVECPNCGKAGATSFDATSLRRSWYACLDCENVWIARRQK